MIAQLFLNLLKSRDTIAVLQRSIYSFLRISSLVFKSVFECMKTVNV